MKYNSQLLASLLLASTALAHSGPHGHGEGHKSEDSKVKSTKLNTPLEELPEFKVNTYVYYPACLLRNSR